MGCDDYTKAQILSFVTNNFVNRGELFTTFISVIDSPYSNVTKNDFNSLVKLAEFNNCPKDVLANYLVSWDRKHARQLMDDLSLADKTQPEPKPFKGGGIEL